MIRTDKPWSVSDFRNENGTYDGVAAIAAITGLAPAEVEWLAKRIQTLTKEGLPKAYVLAIVKVERESEPWKK